MAWVIDLDGVVWLDGQAIAGAPDAIEELRARGEDVVFVTNNSSERLATYEDRLRAIGIPAQGCVISSAMIAASLVAPGERALVCAGAGVVEALEARGAEVVRDGDADVVVVGFHRDFDYERMTAASVAVRRGARLLATNDDPTYPGPDGPIPGGGAILASIVTATGATPVVAGKPYPPSAAYVRERLGTEGVVVGDRPSTDGGFATALGYPFVLVLSGVTHRGDLPVVPEPALVADDLLTAVRALVWSDLGMRSLRSTTVLVALALTVAGGACSAEAGGGGPAEPTVPGLSVEVEPLDGPLSSRFDLDGVELWVGSEDVPTQRLLGYIAVEALASVGADAHDRIGIGGGLLTRESLLSGEIDLYWERLGTAWTGFLREAEVPEERDELYRMLATRDLEENGVVWLTPANFSDGQGFAMAPEFADALEIDNLSDMGDYLGEGMPASVCVTTEFMTFPLEGRVDFEVALGEVPDDVLRVYDPEPVYPATADGTCTFGLIERVNGRVAEYDLRVLDDDIALFGFDNPAVNVREDVYAENPELGPLFAVVADALDEPTMQQLNERVEVGGEDPRTVARDWLVDEGFVEE